jgi:hypothetical protein
MVAAERAAAVDAATHRLAFAGRELAEEAFLYFAGLCVKGWHWWGSV